MLATLLRFAFVPVFVLMGARLFWLIDAYSVDLLFLDHWDYFEGLFSDASLLDLFRWQHGPHRQGVGFLPTKVIAELTGWNLRAEAFVLGAVVCTACALALFLKRRMVGPFRWSDVTIPLVLLTPLQFATFINTPNAAHSALPLLLLLTMALAWEIRRPLARYTTLIALDVAVVHTGFGVFAGLVLPGLFLLEVARNRASPKSPDFLRPLAAFGVSLCVLALFFVGYAPSEATSTSGGMIEEWWSYPRFMAISVSRLFWMRGGRAEPVGFAILALSVWTLIFHARLLLKQPEQAPRSRAVVFFLAFALLFVAAISVGRMPLGLRAGTASRYMTLLTLLYLGLYLGSFSIRPFLREYTLYGAVAFLVYGSVPLRDATVERMEYFHDAKVRWRDTYLTTRDTEAAYHASPLPAYPRPSDPRFRERLRYLEANRLSFFREGGPP
jgi:hypothetical protein